MNAIFDALGVSEGQGVGNANLAKAVERAQRRLGSDHFAMRTRLMQYDQVINEQRELIYSQRRQVLEAQNVHELIQRMLQGTKDGQKALAVLEAGDSSPPEEWQRKNLLGAVDRRWMDHIDSLEQLQESVGLVAYGQRSPVDEYRQIAARLFERMNEEIRQDVASAILAYRCTDT